MQMTRNCSKTILYMQSIYTTFRLSLNIIDLSRVSNNLIDGHDRALAIRVGFTLYDLLLYHWRGVSAVNFHGGGSKRQSSRPSKHRIYIFSSVMIRFS